MKKHYAKYTFILTWVCLAVYVCAFFGVYFTNRGYELNYENLYARLMQETLDFNSSIKRNNDRENQTPLFYDARTAVDYAYNYVINGKGYELSIIGDVDMNASKLGVVNVPIKLTINQTHAKFESGSCFVEMKRYEDGNANGQTIASKRLYKNNVCYTAFSYDISYDSATETVTASNYKDYFHDYEGQFLTYIINKDTIKSELYFKTNYDVYTGKIESYSASVELNTTKAVDGYDKMSRFECGYSSTPVYTKLVIHCIIAPNGTLVSATLQEEFRTTMAKFGGGDLNASNVHRIYVVKANENPSFAEPVIENI